MLPIFTVEKVAHNLGYCSNFSKAIQSKQSPNRPKIAEYGHPAFNDVPIENNCIEMKWSLMDKK
jgi:hypothetical protein